jgi:hypothetical protein
MQEQKKTEIKSTPVNTQMYALKHYWIEMDKDEKKELMKRTGIKSYTTMLSMLDDVFNMRLCQLFAAHKYVIELTGEDINIIEMWSSVSSEIPEV